MSNSAFERSDDRLRYRDLLEDPEIRRFARAITVGEYHALVASGLSGANAELLDGLIIGKMSKSPLYSAAIQKLARKLRAAINDRLDIR